MTWILRSQEIKDRCLKELIGLLACNPPMFEVEIRKFNKSKTGQQRRYFHKVLQMICDHTGDDMEDLKMKIKYRVLPLREIVVEGRSHLYPISSERATVQQYADLITAALMYASAAEVIVAPAHHFGMEIA